MNIFVLPSTISGRITAPSSKSLTHRVLILASLADGVSIIKNALVSNDTKKTVETLKQFGVKIKENSSIEINGTKGNVKAPDKPIDTGLSGSTMRFAIGIAAISDGTTVLTGKERPIAGLISALQNQGVQTKYLKKEGYPPVKVVGTRLSGGTIGISGSVSSQFVSSLLMVCPLAKKTLTIKVSDLSSKPYVALTIDCMRHFGVMVENNGYKEFTVSSGQAYKARTYALEGDYSSTSYFFAAAAVTKGSVTVTNLNPASNQSDRQILDILEKMGCTIKREAQEITVMGPQTLRSIEVDMNDCPDIVPTVAVAAAFAKGKTTIRNVFHLQYKESNRLQTLSLELAKIGISTHVTDNSISIEGGKPKSGTIATHKDHRIAMAFAIAGLAIENGIKIIEKDVVQKSYPNFFHDLKKIGGAMQKI